MSEPKNEPKLRLPSPTKSRPIGERTRDSRVGSFDIAVGSDAGARCRSLQHLRPDGPFRSPAWRTQLAREIATHPDPRVVDHLRVWADGRVEELLHLDRSGVGPCHPLARARALLEPDRYVLRAEVEARLLAGSASAAIAAATGAGADVVGWYHDAFFAVRDRLDARGYVIHVVLGSLPPEGDGSRPPYELLPWYGYSHGPGAVDVLVDVLRNWELDRGPARDGTAAELFRRAARLRVRAAVLARLLPVGDLNSTGRRTLAALASSTRR